MKTQACDAVVVGAGQAGPALAVRLAQSGLRTVLVERGELGGTCVNNGCTPTKTLVASARVAHLARRAADYGVRLEGAVQVDAAAVRARALAVVQQSRDSLRSWIAATDGLTLVHGSARFTSDHTLRVDDALELRGERIFLNVGARPIVPDWITRSGVPYLTNESILGLGEIPEHLVILGAGYISLEYAQIHRRFGAQVTLIEHGPRFLPREDEDTAAAVRAVLEGEGIAIRTGLAATALAAGAGGRGIVLDVAPTDSHAKPTRAGDIERIAGSHLLVAIGRRPNSDSLALAAAGIDADEHGTIRVDDMLRTNVPHVWALGDVNGRGAFTHTSYNDHEIVAANLLGGGPRRASDRIPAYVLYTDPPLARIGLNKDAVRARGLKALRAFRPMARVARAVERGETAGFMEALVDAGSGLLVGATIFGVEGDEVIHSLLDIMAAHQPAATIARTMHVHPTVSELVPTMLQEMQPLD